MKKIIAIFMVLAMGISMVACTTANTTETPEATKTPAATAPATFVDTKSEGVMTYAQYAAAEFDTQVVIEAYIQAKQGWWVNDKNVGVATFYTQDTEGAYLLYDMPCSEEDYNNKLTVGTKVKVTGYKATWGGVVEIIDATYEVIEGATYVAPAMDATNLLGSEDLVNHMIKKVAFKGMTVVASTNKEGVESAFLYNWDGSGTQGNDIYFNAKTADGKVCTFVIESYLTGKDTDVYKAAEALTIGSVIDLEGLLYWYETNPQPHITTITTVNQ